jgi:hypothetical protein
MINGSGATNKFHHLFFIQLNSSSQEPLMKCFLKKLEPRQIKEGHQNEFKQKRDEFVTIKLKASFVLFCCPAPRK